MSKRTLIILPTYNEADNLRPLVLKILGLGLEADLLVVDDSSADGTGNIALELSQEYPGRVFLLSRPGKLGLGTAHRDGFFWGFSRGYQQMVTMDTDFSHPPEALPVMLERLNDFALVIGSRYVKGGRTEGWPLARKINSRTANFLARRLMGLKARDCTGAFRAYQSDWLKKVPFDRLRARGYSAHLEILYYLQKIGAGFTEIPITFVNREKGKSKISFRELKEAIGVIFYYFFKRPEL